MAKALPVWPVFRFARLARPSGRMPAMVEAVARAATTTYEMI